MPCPSTITLQYAYEHDVELIDRANRIVEFSLKEKPDEKVLQEMLSKF